MILINRVVIERAFSEKPGARIDAMEGANINMIIEMQSRKILTNVNVELAMDHASSSPLFFLYSMKTGTKVIFKILSPTDRKKRNMD